jgi:hypothetical protein
VKRWQKAVIAILALGVLLIGSGWVVQRVPALKNAVRTVLQATGLERMVMPLLQKAGLATPTLPEHCLPIVSSDRVSARRLMVVALYEALARGDFEQAALLNGVLAQEAYQRSHPSIRVMRSPRAWRSALAERVGPPCG